MILNILTSNDYNPTDISITFMMLAAVMRGGDKRSTTAPLSASQLTSSLYHIGSLSGG
jgi:hypothetical protein